MITLIVKINVIPEHFWDFVDACRIASTQALRTERQCRAYTVNQDPDNENGVILVEIYDNQEAIDFHKTTPHFLEWREIANKLTISRTITRLESL
jgi:quinol monooxygenase YgiN